MGVPRRRFLHTLAAAPLLPGLGHAGPATPQAAAPPAPAPTPATPPEAALREETADALTRVIEKRFGAQLESADLDTIRKGIGDALRTAERLRAVPLANGDEPATVFHARPPGAAAAGGGATPRGGTR